jgi:RHS repeat-associated protein
VGNRSSAVSSLSPVPPGNWTYNADDEVSSESYDLNGNTTQTANGNQYTYDSENHMLSMANGSTLVNMIYDAFGNRVAKTVTNLATRVSSTTQYLVDGLNPTGYPQVMEELSGPIGAGAVARSYTYGLQRISQNQIIQGAWTPSFYGYDDGNARQLTNSVGQVTDEYEYDAYGNSFTKSGTTPNNYLYRGEQYDPDLGLYYLRARYYNPATGRFLSRDPEAGQANDPRTLHKYLYAGGDPVNAVDPTGRDNVMAWTIAGFSVAIYSVKSLHDLGVCMGGIFDSIKNIFNYIEHTWNLDLPTGPAQAVHYRGCITDFINEFFGPMFKVVGWAGHKLGFSGY